MNDKEQTDEQRGAQLGPPPLLALGGREPGHTKHASFHWLAAAVAVAIVLLLVATMHLPYWYYQVLRWPVCPVFLFSWFWTHSDKAVETLSFLEGSVFSLAFIVLTIVFNPLWPVHMPRATWFWLDISAATVLGVFLFGQVIGRRKATKPR
jgi:hypothetical protein